MSYEIQSQKLNPNKVFILQKSELEKRFDPLYYAHEFNEYEKKLVTKPFKKFHQLLKSINNGFDFRDYQKSGTPYLKVANVKQGELDFSKIQYINFNSSEIAKNIQLKKGNLLLTRKGSFGNAFALDKDYDFVISSEVFYIELHENSINPKFLEIFLNSKIGQAQFDKNKIGAIMGSLSQEAIKELKIPIPKTEIQEKIVAIYNNYVEQKKQNELEAEKLLSSIDDYLLKALGIELPQTSENTLQNRIFTTSIKEISGGRFDPFFHQIKFTENTNAISNGKYPVKELKEIILGNLIKGLLPKSEEKDGNNSVVQINSINMDGTINLDDLLTAKDIFTKEQKLQNGDVLVVITGATIGKIAQWNYLGDYYLGGDIVKFQTNELAYNSFVFNFLRCILSQTEIKKNITGATNGHLSPDDIKRFLIPIPPIEKQKEIADHITTIRTQARQLTDKTNEVMKKASEEIEQILLQ